MNSFDKFARITSSKVSDTQNSFLFSTDMLVKTKSLKHSKITRRQLKARLE